MFDPEALARYAVNLSLNHKIDINKTISELAKKSSLNSEQIKRIVEQANNILYKETFSKSPSDVLKLSLADPAQAVGYSQELLKAAEILSNEDSITGPRIGSSVDDLGIDYVKRATTRARLQQLKSDLSGDIISAFMRMQEGVENVAGQIVDSLISKEATLNELYEVIESNCPNLTKSIISKVNERLNDSFIKFAFDGELFSNDIKVRKVNPNNALVMKLKWLNETFDDTRAKLDAYQAVNASLERYKED